jgi:hypothetical protein
MVNNNFGLIYLKNLFFIYIIFSLYMFSCQKTTVRNIEFEYNPQDLIGKNVYSDEPFNNPDWNFYRYIHIDGKRLYSVGTLYNIDTAIIFISENNIVIDYFLTRLIKYKEYSKIPLGTSHEIIIEKLGKPPLVYDKDYYDDFDPYKEYNSPAFKYTYFKLNNAQYKIAENEIMFSFNNEGKLISIVISKVGTQ